MEFLRNFVQDDHGFILNFNDTSSDRGSDCEEQRYRPTLASGCPSLIRTNEVTGFSDRRAGHVHPPQIIFSLSMTQSSGINCLEPRSDDQAIVESITTRIHESDQGELRHSPNLQKPGVRQLAIKGLFACRRDANSRAKRMFNVSVLGYCISISFSFLRTRISFEPS